MLYRTFYDAKTDSGALEHALGRALLGCALTREYGIAFTEDMLAFTARGKPYLAGYPNIFFSISHCAGCVVCAVADRPVGADTERVRRFDMRVAARVCSAAERARCFGDPDEYYIKLWTLKESYAKATGEGLALGFAHAEFDISGETLTSCIPGYAFALRQDGAYFTALALKTHT